jgi:hypothetical protein
MLCDRHIAEYGLDTKLRPVSEIDALRHQLADERAARQRAEALRSIAIDTTRLAVERAERAEEAARMAERDCQLAEKKLVEMGTTFDAWVGEAIDYTRPLLSRAESAERDLSEVWGLVDALLNKLESRVRFDLSPRLLGHPLPWVAERDALLEKRGKR